MDPFMLCPPITLQVFVLPCAGCIRVFIMCEMHLDTDEDSSEDLRLWCELPAMMNFRFKPLNTFVMMCLEHEHK